MSAIIDYAKGRTLVVATHSHAVATCLDKAWRIAGETLLPVALPAHEKGVA
jgi:ATP-binding cassette subfamily C protein CydD